MTGIARVPIFLVLISVPFMFACTTKPYTQKAMSTPEVMGKGVIDPFAGDEEWKEKDSLGILFATNRTPAAEDAEVPFLNERDVLLHLGVATVKIEKADVNQADLKDIDYLKDNSKSITLGLDSVTTFGPLDSALHGLVDTSRLPEDIHEPAGRFAEIVNKRLAFNPVKDIFIYVHGVNTSFESPLLVASELWHYLGYRGVFIAFSWPSGQNIMEYVTDVDTAEYSAVQFRRFLEYLISETEAERIHILASSAGTKLVTLSLHQIGLMELCRKDENPGSTRIGRVLFAAGDVERQLFGMYVSDKLLEPIDSLTVYMSSSDKALNASRSIRRYPRLGQPWASEDISPEALSYIKNSGKLEFIDVSGQEGVQEGAGHEYFRSSPWVSSDILANLALGVPPDKRGLVLQENQVYWSFPEDYIERLSLALEQLKFEKSLMQIPSP